MSESDLSEYTPASKVQISSHEAFCKSLSKITETLAKVTQETGESIFKTASDNVQNLVENTQQTITDNVQNLVENTQQTIHNLSQVVDPKVIGGGFVGMSAGEVVGGTLGGALGSVIGPGGTVAGAAVGSFAGQFVGFKIASGKNIHWSGLAKTDNADLLDEESALKTQKSTSI